MFSIGIFFSAITLALSLDLLPDNQGQIIGGTTASIENYPHQVQLFYNDNFLCGGSIISKYTILTAAHCLQLSLDPASYTVRAGTNRLGVDGVLKTVSKLQRHELYNSNTYDYDVAVLTLSSPLEFSSSIKVISLANSVSGTGTSCKLSGWGKTSSSQPPSHYLQELTMYKIGNLVCKPFYLLTTFTSRMMCADAWGAKNFCNGDSGGALICNNKQEGIVSYHRSCDDLLRPGVFASVPNMYNWISQRITH